MVLHKRYAAQAEAGEAPAGDAPEADDVEGDVVDPSLKRSVKTQALLNQRSLPTRRYGFRLRSNPFFDRASLGSNKSYVKTACMKCVLKVGVGTGYQEGYRRVAMKSGPKPG